MVAERMKIGFVDDDEEDYELFRDALMEIDPSISTFYINDSSKVLPELKDKKPHLVFLDTNLPTFDSFTALQQIKQDPDISSIKVIVYSGVSNYEKVRLAYGLRAERFLLKPMTSKSTILSLGIILALFNENALGVDSFDQFVINPDTSK